MNRFYIFLSLVLEILVLTIFIEIFYNLNIMNEYLLGENKFLIPICWKIFILVLTIISVMELVYVTKIMIAWHTQEK